MSAYFDASDDDFPTSAVDEPTVVFDQSGMRIPAYALEGVLADQPVFEPDDPDIEKLLAKMAQLRRFIDAKNTQLKKKLADPANRAKFAAMGTKGTLDVAKGRANGLGVWPLDYVTGAATAAYDAATDLMIGQSIGTQAKARENAEHLKQMVEERVNSGQITGPRAEQLTNMANDNIKALDEPAKTFVKTTVSETAKNAGKLGLDLAWMGKTLKKVAIYGIPIGLGLYLLTFALKGGKMGSALAKRAAR